jgi:cell fate regulator YaaT (PSP1 superfamily)
VESGTGGYDVGVISMSGALVKLQMKRKRVQENSDEIKSVLRRANEYDLKKWEDARKLDRDTMVRARAIARQMSLNMKIGDVEYQGDGRKATFYYTAEERVDFRELIKVFAKEFHVKIDMHQIGARQEAGRIGGIGSCGRELCCSTWLTDFKTVSTGAARYQQMSINQAKLSGQCGRLKCCLNYELDTYLDALHDFPQNIDKIETETGVAFLQKTDIFKRLLWFTYKDSSVFHPLTVERVKEIAQMNKDGQKPADLGAVKLAPVKETYEFTDVVGQTTLASLESKSKKKKKSGNKNKNWNRGSNNKPLQTPRKPGSR